MLHFLLKQVSVSQDLTVCTQIRLLDEEQTFPEPHCFLQRRRNTTAEDLKVLVEHLVIRILIRAW